MCHCADHLGQRDKPPIRLLPHIAVFVLSQDLDRYGFNVDGREPRTVLERVTLFIRMMTFIPEYRNVFYLRHKTIGHILGLFMSTVGIIEN